MTKRISIKEVAKAAGVSPATVSNVFNRKKSVDPKLVDKVRKVADDLGYQVNKAASLLRSGKNSVVAVLVPDLSDPYFTSIVREIEDLAQDDGFEIIVGNSNNDTKREIGRLNALLGWQPAGLIVVPCSDILPAPLHETYLPPCILVDRVARLDLFDSVTSNNVQAGQKAAKLLIESGHKSLLIAASSLAHAAIRERADGAVDAMEKQGGITNVIELGTEIQHAKEKLARWFDNNPLPSAILATTDTTTLAVLSCVSKRHIEIPEQISVIGFDDYTWMAARRTGITSIKQPVPNIANSAWEQLKKRISGDDSEVVNIVHECDMVLRDSVRKNMGKLEYIK